MQFEIMDIQWTYQLYVERKKVLWIKLTFFMGWKLNNVV
jgi:hypothetical protein